VSAAAVPIRSHNVASWTLVPVDETRHRRWTTGPARQWPGLSDAMPHGTRSARTRLVPAIRWRQREMWPPRRLRARPGNPPAASQHRLRSTAMN